MESGFLSVLSDQPLIVDPRRNDRLVASNRDIASGADGSCQARSRSEKGHRGLIPRPQAPLFHHAPGYLMPDKDIDPNHHRPEGFGRNGAVFVVAPPRLVRRECRSIPSSPRRRVVNLLPLEIRPRCAPNATADVSVTGHYEQQ